MIYSLKCGNCLSDNNVSATADPILWVCNSCGNENSSSLPSMPSGDLITDPSKADALLTPSEADNAKNVVTGMAMSDVVVDVPVGDS